MGMSFSLIAFCKQKNETQYIFIVLSDVTCGTKHDLEKAVVKSGLDKDSVRGVHIWTESSG